MHTIARLLLLMIAASLVSSCSILKQLDLSGQYLVTAGPLDRNQIADDLKNSGIDSPTSKDKILAYLSQSQTKCSVFVSGLVLHHTASDTMLDIGTTVATTTAAVITAPVSAIRAFAGLGAITSGSKTAIDTDFFAKASVANFAQAIQSTYYTKIDSYIAQIKDSNSLDPSVEYFNIERIHSLCGLGPAEGSISASLQPSPGANNVPGPTVNQVEYDITIAGTTKAGGIVTVTGSSTTLPGIPPASITFKATDKPADIAKALVDKINSVIGTAQPTISASVTKANPNVVAIVSSQADAIKWTAVAPNANTGITVTGAAAVSAGASSSTEYDITVSGTATGGGTIKITGTSTKISTISPVSVAFVQQQASADVATAIVAAFAPVTAVQPTITAAVVNGHTNVVAIKSSASDAITWTITVPDASSGITVTGMASSNAGAPTAALELKAETPPTGSAPPSTSGSPVVHVLPGSRIQ